MTRFRIEFEGRATATRAEVDASLEQIRKRLVDLWIADPAVSATVAAIEVRIAFVIDAADTLGALEGGHALLRQVTADGDLTGVSWTAARAEIGAPGV